VKDDISKEKKVKEKKDKTSNPEKVRKTNTVKNSIKKVRRAIDKVCL